MWKKAKEIGPHIKNQDISDVMWYQEAKALSSYFYSIYFPLASIANSLSLSISEDNQPPFHIRQQGWESILHFYDWNLLNTVHTHKNCVIIVLRKTEHNLHSRKIKESSKKTITILFYQSKFFLWKKSNYYRKRIIGDFSME